MLGYDHALSAIAASAAIGTLALHEPPWRVAIAAAVAAGAGVLPDLDQRGSCVARSFGWITEIGAVVVRKVSGGHRKETHAALGDIVLGLIAAVAIALEPVRFAVRFHGYHGHLAYYGRWSAGAIILGAYLALLLGSAMKALRIARRGNVRREALAIAAAVSMVYFHVAGEWVAWSVLLGTVVHVLGDGLTDSGIQPFLPFSDRTVHLLPEPFAFTTGTRPETMVVRPVLLFSLAVLASWAAVPGLDMAAWNYGLHLL